MIWLQGLTCFAVWLAYGYFRSRSSDKIRARLAGMSRRSKAASGAGLMILGAAILFGVLVFSYATGGFTVKGMTIPTWIMVAVGGLAFVHAQTMAMAMLVALMLDGVVTSHPGPSSDHHGQDAAQP
jgi:hypothetical protein